MADNPAIKHCVENWRIHKLYIRNEFDECLKLIEEQLKACRGLCEFPIYIKGLVLRRRGKIQESLQLFQAAVCLNPHNLLNIKQVARSLFLLGKHRAAIEVYEEAQSGDNEDWQLWHHCGLCHLHMKSFDKAINCFRRSNLISRQDETFMQLSKTYVAQEDFQGAIDVYLDALEFSPDSSEILTALGLLYLRIGESFKAFEYLGNALTNDPKNAKTILAAGSIIQDNNDMAVALMKYRVAAVQTPNSAPLWNNVGMCFFGMLRLVDAIACLKRALYWIISYNLGLVHLNTSQFASAFHYFSAFLSRLDDFDNSCSAYEKAIEMETDHLFHLNYAITLFKHEHVKDSRNQLQKFEAIFDEMEEETKSADQDVAKQYTILKKLLES